MTHEKIQLDFWNVGQGDASTITWPNGKITIIDCGPKKSPLVNFIIRERPFINNIFITHNDSDHIGGLYPIVKQNHAKIESIGMLCDRSTPHLGKIISQICETFDKNKIKRLECVNDQSNQLFEYSDYSIEIYHPQFVNNVTASTANDTSAILCLKYKNDIIVAWAADNSLQTVSSKCPLPVSLLFGPHHGAPVERKKTSAIAHLRNIKPSQCFLSFATKNAYSHPNRNYIAALREVDCSVTCSQLAKKCFTGNRTQPVFNGDGRYAQKSPVGSDQISCHGHTRFYVQGTTVFDEYKDEYRQAVSLLPKALCNKT